MGPGGDHRPVRPYLRRRPFIPDALVLDADGEGIAPVTAILRGHADVPPLAIKRQKLINGSILDDD